MYSLLSFILKNKKTEPVSKGYTKCKEKEK